MKIIKKRTKNKRKSNNFNGNLFKNKEKIKKKNK